MLIHDDIIDRDDISYGVRNISGSYLDHYETLVPDTNERRHFARSAAILAGDLLLSDAYRLIAQLQVPASAILAAQSLLNEAIYSVVGGELLDTEAAFKKLASAHPEIIATYKTAGYSFVMPLLIGATIAGAPAEDLTILRHLGTKVGIAYQMRDDYLGVLEMKRSPAKVPTAISLKASAPC
jgi:geranylgeranyl diphosphate synthase type II